MSKIQVQLLETMGSDKSIAHSAWTSSLDIEHKDLKTEADVNRVVNMLADLKHSVPFESVIFRFWIRMPIATDRQHMTHRIASHSGMSGRYRTMPNDFLAIPDDVLEIEKKLPTTQYDSRTPYVYNSICTHANKLYQEIIQKLKLNKAEGLITDKEFKRLREFYRGMLPQHNMTERVSVFNLRSFANYYKLRSKADAQPEIQIVANLMYEEVVKSGICPIALEALARNNWEI